MQNASTTYRNITEICELEKKALARRSLSARIGDAIATEAGRMWFIIFHLIWFAAWLLLNMKSKGNSTFDPFPFPDRTTITVRCYKFPDGACTRIDLAPSPGALATAG